MSGGEILTAVGTVLLGVITSVIAALNLRPKVKAEAKAANTGGDVAVSTDAREWVREFRADAQEARERATRAEQRAEDAERRLDDLEDRVNLLVRSLIEHRTELAKFPGAVLPSLPDGIEA